MTTVGQAPRSRMRVPLPALPQLPQLLPRVEAALDAVVALERALRTLPEEILLLRREIAILSEVRDDMRGMRADIRDVIGSVDGLRAEIGLLPPDVQHLRGTVDGMYDAVSRLEDQVDIMGGSLDAVDRIAARVVHPLRRRTRPRGGAAEDPLDDELAEEERSADPQPGPPGAPGPPCNAEVDP